MPAPADHRLSEASSDRCKSYRAELEEYPVDDPSQIHPFASSSDDIGNGAAQLPEIAPFMDFRNYTSQPTTREEPGTEIPYANRQLRRKANFGPSTRTDVPSTSLGTSMIPEPLSNVHIPIRSSSLASRRNTISSIGQIARGSSISGHREVAPAYDHRQSVQTAPGQGGDEEEEPSTDPRQKSRFSKTKALLRSAFALPKSARKMLRGSTKQYFRRKQPR